MANPPSTEPPPPYREMDDVAANTVREGPACAFLREQGVPPALQALFVRNLAAAAYRFYIVDNSGSMDTEDGRRLVKDGGGCRTQACSRWRELTESLRFQAGLAHAAGIGCEFRLLNNFPPLQLGVSDARDAQAFASLQMAFDSSPSSGTPLCTHIREVERRIREMRAEKTFAGKRFVVVICTDGEATDGDLAAAMKPLEQLPVSVVVRLCTDNDSVVSYWNNVDGQLELDMDVLDDLFAEAREVAAKNPWLVYNEYLHHLRIMGGCGKEFDVLDEKLLSADQLRSFVANLTGQPLQTLPHPADGWTAFSHTAHAAVETNGLVFSPLTHSRQPVLDLPTMARAYHRLSGAEPLQQPMPLLAYAIALLILFFILKSLFFGEPSTPSWNRRGY